MKARVVVGLLPVFFAAHAHAEIFSKSYRVLCPSSADGCACFAEPRNDAAVVGMYHHYQPVEGESDEDQVTPGELEWVGLIHEEQRCFMRSRDLRPITWANDRCPDPVRQRDIPFAAPSVFLKKGSVDGQRVALGKIFPTFYNIAEEVYHTGEKTVALYDLQGKLIARVTQDFRDDLDMEGTGRLEDGRVLNVGQRVDGVWKYVVLPRGSYGLGIYGHYLYPYRAAAIDFDYLCEKGSFAGCSTSTVNNRKLLVGALLYIPRLEGMPLPNGDIHDGYVCAQDIGGAIKKDRIDLFVGPSGGGNPYLPVCQSHNAYTDYGVNTLTPFDWHTWVETGTDPQSGRRLFERPYPYEYRTASPSKELEIQVVKGAFCKGLW